MALDSCLTLSQDGNPKRLMLSQHMFGWPEHRPRLYTVMTLTHACYLADPGLALVKELFRTPSMSVSSLFCAPEETWI